MSWPYAQINLDTAGERAFDVAGDGIVGWDGDDDATVRIWRDRRSGAGLSFRPGAALYEYRYSRIIVAWDAQAGKSIGLFFIGPESVGEDDE